MSNSLVITTTKINSSADHIALEFSKLGLELTFLAWTIFVLRGPVKILWRSFQWARDPPLNELQVVEHAVTVLMWIYRNWVSFKGCWKLGGCVCNAPLDRKFIWFSSGVCRDDWYSKQIACKHLPAVTTVNGMVNPQG